MNRYQVQGVIGIGPDGPVHRAVAERLRATPVALRRLRIPAGPARHLLRIDAETVATIGHPVLAVVEDIVEIDDETVEVATTLGDHGSLADRLALGPCRSRRRSTWSRPSAPGSPPPTGPASLTVASPGPTSCSGRTVR